MRPSRPRLAVPPPWRTALLAALALVVRVGLAQADAAIEVHVTPARIELGTNSRARLEIRGPDVPLEQLEVGASVGTIRALSRAGPGLFVAQYVPPPSRAPDVAVLVARVRESDAVGTAALPLLGRYHLTVTVEPAARVVVRVGALPEHRAISPATGVIDLLLHVPPGVNEARITATDRFGNATESAEPIAAPPSHRIVLLNAPPPSSSPGALRWFVVATNPQGVPATISNAPSLLASEGLPEVSLVAPGVLQVVLRPERRPEARSVSLTARQQDAIATPASLSAVVPAAVPARAELGAVGVRAGEPFTVPLSVRDEGGAPIVRLEAAIAAQVERVGLARVEARGDGYALIGRAPERVGNADVTVRVTYPGMTPVETRGPLRVVAGPAARVSAREVSLVVGRWGRVELRAVDRFGNPTAIENPTVRGEGAAVDRLEPSGAALSVRVEPSAVLFALEVRGDYDLRERIALRALPRPPERPIALAVMGVARSNLGALWMWGARARLDVRLPLGRDALVLQLDAGLEAGALRDPQGLVSADVQAAPVFLRVGYLARAGVVELGPILGAGGRGVMAVARADSGEVSHATSITPGFQGAILLRARVGFSVIFAELGQETGSLDGPVRGTLGGTYGAIGWGLGL